MIEISARNQLEGKIVKITIGNVMAEVVIRVGRNNIVAAITRDSIDRLGLRLGDKATAVFKATEVMVMK